MIHVQALTVLHFWLLAAATWVLIYVCWRPYRLDALRDDLFEIRHRLFMYAASGAIPFDHPAYGRLRSNINSLIRFAEQLTITRAILFSLLVPVHLQEPSRPEHELEGLSEEARNKLDQFEREAGARLLAYAVNGSPLLVVFYPIRSLSRANDLAAKTATRMRREILRRLEVQVRDEYQSTRSQTRHPTRAF